MRLLWMKSDYVVPPDSGGKIRTYNLLKQLHRLCEVTYLSFKPDKSPNTEPEIQACASNVVTVFKPDENKQGVDFYLRVLRGLASPLPYILQKYRHADMSSYQRNFFNGHNTKIPSVLLCDFLEMSENVDWSLPCPKVLFQHNVESMIWQRYFENETNPLKKAYFDVERKRMARYESAACNRFDLVFTVSEEDKTYLQREMGVKTAIDVLETGVDTEYFAPSDTPAIPNRLCFLGSLDWMPNIDGMQWFIKEVYPLIRTEVPAVTLDIVGRRPVAMIQDLVDQDPTIALHANVPDVRPFLAQGELSIVPLRIGGGSRIKIYEAMAMGRPVVSTTIGAEGLPLIQGAEIAIGDSPREFADQVIRYLRNATERELLARQGYTKVIENYQWKNVAQKLFHQCSDLALSK